MHEVRFVGLQVACDCCEQGVELLGWRGGRGSHVLGYWGGRVRLIGEEGNPGGAWRG